MQFGVVLPHNEIGTDPGALKAYVQGAEALGARQLLIYDHVLGADPARPGGWRGVYDKDVAFHEPLTTLAFIAALTQTMELVTTILILPQRQTVLVAKQAAEVAILSNNRLRLGVGTGWNKIEYEALNEDFASRGARQSEQIEVMRALWSQDVVDFHGKYHRIDQAGLNPRPSQPVPLWFGGSAPALVRRCARLGDGWIPLMGPSAAAAEIIGELQRQRAELGKNWADFSILAQAQYAGGTPERWRGHAGKWQALGATHMAIATHNAGVTDVDGHLARTEAYFKAVQDV
ncbi:MAG: LLM class F420-dependent oxidoreductase [Pseudomonadales bacterium]|jgi:probable F420-dependent oxidoreductase|nr:LLM class F420-dependent oxidoreductase [Pseudomonadales bacterium]MDP4639399.1 LLM class F420-dependent oxidoreductase [Pseudomonadales bacterium]MDP4766251.1 LLM class F420-dependent oxidoreductase [Pseudomonadales bacterium]MDP4876121.1 LLM class F420-dependent oxidoreductase [Pseudomonadales bacterium]MDP4911964.1 LLM class F420-dependent oxidoreductase [Pseudomonadales bacterium]